MFQNIKSRLTEPETGFTTDELLDAHRSLLSTLSKCEKVLKSARLPQSQRTLTKRRVAALKLALSLIEKEQRQEHSKASSDSE